MPKDVEATQGWSMGFTSQARWVAALAVLLALAIAPSCRRSRFPPRGDAAAVVVVAPRKDAAPAPTLSEQEPNDQAEQAQALGLTADLPRLVLEGALALSAEGKLKDVDVFKLLVPGGSAPTSPSAVDSGRVEDPRVHARRLSVEVAVEGNAGLSLQLLDEASKVMEGIVVQPSQTGGMPNLAVAPGQTYYLRIRESAKPAKPGASPAARLQVSTRGAAGRLRGGRRARAERNPGAREPDSRRG